MTEVEQARRRPSSPDFGVQLGVDHSGCKPGPLFNITETRQLNKKENPSYGQNPIPKTVKTRKPSWPYEDLSWKIILPLAPGSHARDDMLAKMAITLHSPPDRKQQSLLNAEVCPPPPFTRLWLASL